MNIIDSGGCTAASTTGALFPLCWGVRRREGRGGKKQNFRERGGWIWQ